MKELESAVKSAGRDFELLRARREQALQDHSQGTAGDAGRRAAAGRHAAPCPQKPPRTVTPGLQVGASVRKSIGGRAEGLLGPFQLEKPRERPPSEDL